MLALLCMSFPHRMLLMSQEQWTAVDRYITELVVPADAVLDAVLADSVAAGLPTISVSPNQGKFLNLLARIQGARSILEIGTLGGYSTIWLARAMPEGGRLITLESEPKHADVARANIVRQPFRCGHTSPGPGTGHAPTARCRRGEAV